MTSKARSTHEQSRARNKKFAEIAQAKQDQHTNNHVLVTRNSQR